MSMQSSRGCGRTSAGFSRGRRAAIRALRRTETAACARFSTSSWLIDTIITLYIWILIASAILSWLVAFNVVNARNPVVANIGEFLYRITEPALRPIRAILPNLGGIDISPVILILLSSAADPAADHLLDLRPALRLAALEMRGATR